MFKTRPLSISVKKSNQKFALLLQGLLMFFLVACGSNSGVGGTTIPNNQDNSTKPIEEPEDTIGPNIGLWIGKNDAYVQSLPNNSLSNLEISKQADCKNQSNCTNTTIIPLDGTVQQTSDLSFSHHPKQLLYRHSDKFKAIDMTGTVYSNPYARHLNAEETFCAIEFADTLWQFSLKSSKLYAHKSTDGVTWKSAKIDQFKNNTGYKDIYIPSWGESNNCFVDNNKIVITSSYGSSVFKPGTLFIASSEDGISWTIDSVVLDEAPKFYRTIYFKNKIWVIGGSHSQYWKSNKTENQSGKSSIYTYENSSLKKIASDLPFGVLDHATLVAFDNKIWLLGFQKYTVFTDPDGNKREQANSNWGNEIWNSTDGINWQKITPTPSSDMLIKFNTATVFNNKLFTFGGLHQQQADGKNIYSYVNDIYSSIDGIQWNKHAGNILPGFIGVTPLVYRQQLWLFSPKNYNLKLSGHIYKSDNGLNWYQYFRIKPHY